MAILDNVAGGAAGAFGGTRKPVSLADYGNLSEQDRLGVTEVDAGDGTIGRRVNGGWQYDWRSDPYQDPLGMKEIEQQRGITAAHQAAAARGERIDATDANLLGGGGSPRDQALSQVSNIYSSGGPGGVSGPGAIYGGGNTGVAGGIPGSSPVPQGPNGGYGAGAPGTLRDALMKALGQAGQAPTVDDPGIREMLAGQRLALQRSAERQRNASAEGLGALGLADSGAADTSRFGIEQARGEAEARGIGDALYPELQGRRNALMNLLGMGLQDDQFGRSLGQQESQFGRSLAQNQGQFQDRMGLDWTALQQQSNLQALLAILNSL